MTRLPLLAVMMTTSVLAVLGTGVAWLRQAPVPPANLQAITAGMTLGQIEGLVGKPLDGSHTCMGTYYSVDIPSRLIDGQRLCLVIKTIRHQFDVQHRTFSDLAHGDEICTRVSFQHWSKIAYFNHHDWLFPLLALSDT